MSRRDKLEQLQHMCKGKGKQNLYHLIGVQGTPPDHQDLRKRLARKRDSWSKMANKEVHLAIVEQALELLETPSDKAEYDRFLQSPAEPQAPPVNPQQQPWGPDQPPMPSPRYQQQPAQPKRGAGLSIDAKLVMAGLALVALSLLMTGMVPWGVRPPGTTTTAEPRTGGNGTEEPRGPAGVSGANGERTRPPDSSSRDASRPTATGSSPLATTAGREAGSGTAASTTLPPTPDDSSPARPTAMPEAQVADSGTPSAEPMQAPAATTVAVAAEPVVLAPPVQPPVVEPVRVGGNVAQPRKTWSVQPEYPRMERMRRIEGIVVLEVTLDRQGNVSNVSVLRSDAEGFGEAAVEAVRQWRYEPTIINGGPVSVVFTETVRFQIQN